MATEVLDTSGRRHRGLLSGSDLAGWRATTEPPVTLDHGGHTVCKTGPWGQGPVFLAQLALLEGLEPRPRDGAEYVHTVVEAAKLAFADREAFYGDAMPVPLEALLGPGYADERRALIGERASLELRPGAPAGAEPRLPAGIRAGAAAGVGIGEPSRGDTCHRSCSQAPNRHESREDSRTSGKPVPRRMLEPLA